MKGFLRIFRYTLNYKVNIVLNIFFNFLSSVFSLFSIVMLIPLLEILFEERELMTTKPEFSFSIHGFLDQVNYFISQQVVSGSQLEGLIAICIIVILIFLLKNIFRYLASFSIIPLRNGVVKDIRVKLYNHALQLPLGFYSESRKGDMIARMTTDVQEIEWGILNTLESVVKEPITILIFLSALIAFNPVLTLFVLVLLPVSGLLIGYIGRTLKRQSKKGQNVLGMIISTIEETLAGLRIVKAFNGHRYQEEKFDGFNQQWKKIMTGVMRRRDLASPTTEVLGIGIVVILIWFGGRMVFEGEIEAAVLLTFIVLFSQILNPAKAFAASYFYIQKGLASVERIEDILNAEIKIKDDPNAVALESFEDRIEYQNVSFAYEEKEVLKTIELSIPKGSMVALVGQSGSGKSTIADLLPRFHDIEKGEIMIDGKNIKSYTINSLRSQMGIVTQESILFNDTVKNNIAYGLTEIDDEAIINAAKVANAHEYIVKMTNGYDTIIGDRGTKLSGGERQRLTIARAVLKNPPILILDEATSSLDTESERLVQDALHNLMKNRTSLVIAHRLSTIKHADEIIVLGDGEILERGTHSDLIAKGGAYKRLVELQTFGEN